MSAFLCSSYHVGRLAAYIVAKQERYVKYHADVPETLVGEELARLVSAKLAVALITSIQARYPDTIENFSGAPGVISDTAEGEGGYLTACAQAASLDWRSDHRPEDMIQAADCFDYQACEAETWKECEAFRLIRLAKDSAVSDLTRDLEAEGWELKEEQSKRPAGISIMDMMRD